MSTKYPPTKNSAKSQDEQLDPHDSINFDDNYNEEEYLKKQHNIEKENTQIEKLSIMGDFNQLCKKMNIPGNEEQQSKDHSKDDFLGQYYTKLKQNKQIKDNITQAKTKLQSSIQFKQSQNIDPSFQNGMTSKIPLLKVHQRNPSHEQFFKKSQPNFPIGSSNKRTYSSVQGGDKYKIPLHLNNQGHPNLKAKISQQRTSVYRSDNANKDYYGEGLDNFAAKKVHGKNFINTKEKQNIQILNKIEEKDQKIEKKITKNEMKLSNMKVQSSNDKLLDSHVFDKPTIIIYKKMIDLTVDTQKLRQEIQRHKLVSDYNLSENQSGSQNQSMEQGLFGKAITHQRNTKTVQNVQSYRQHEYSPNHQQEYKQPKYNKIIHSPNPSFNRISQAFQKKNYR